MTKVPCPCRAPFAIQPIHKRKVVEAICLLAKLKFVEESHDLAQALCVFCRRLIVRPRTPFDAGGCVERFESPGISSPASEPAAFTRPPVELFSSMGNCPALQGIINRIAGFPVMRCMFLLCFS